MGCPVAALHLPGVGWGLFGFRSPGSFAHHLSQSPSPFSVTCAHLIVRLSVATKTPPLTSPQPDPSSPDTSPLHPRSIQSAGPLLPGHRFLHPRAPHRQAPTACHHQEPPQVLLDGQWHERRHDARALLLAGQWGRGWRQQGQQSQAVQVHPAAAEPPPELLTKQLQDLLAAGGSAWECSWRALGPVLCAGDFGHIAPPGRHGGRTW